MRVPAGCCLWFYNFILNLWLRFIYGLQCEGCVNCSVESRRLQKLIHAREGEAPSPAQPSHPSLRYYLYANDMSATSQNNAVSHFLPPDPSNESFPMGGVRRGEGQGGGWGHLMQMRGLNEQRRTQ